MRYETGRRYVVVETMSRWSGETVKLGVPFVIAEVAGCRVDPFPPRAEIGPYSSDVGDDVEAAWSGIGSSFLTREQLKADPALARALDRWESGDDSALAEYARLELADRTNPDILNGLDPILSEWADDAERHGPIAVPS